MGGRVRAAGAGLPGRGLRPARGCSAAYYPETNPLVPLEHTAEGSNQPAYKSVIVRLEPYQGDSTGVIATNDADRILPDARGDEKKRYPEPHQLS